MKNIVYAYCFIHISIRVACDLFDSDHLFWFMDGVMMALTAIYLYYQSTHSLRNKVALWSLLLLCACQSSNQLGTMLVDKLYFHWFQVVVFVIGSAELSVWAYENWDSIKEWFTNKITLVKKWLDGL